MKIFLDNKFLLGLYFFLRQTQLSIDRSLPDEWKSLVEFFKSKTSAGEVLGFLQNSCEIDLDGAGSKSFYQLQATNKLLLKVTGNKCFLTEDELVFIYSRLKSFDELQTATNSPDEEFLVALRMDLAHMENLVKARVGDGVVVRQDDVEHFNQNNILKTKSLEELVGTSWP